MSLLRLQSRLDTLNAWEREGMQFRLCPDVGGLQWRGGDDWQREHVRGHKREFTEALRHRAGLCVRCGLDPAKRPDQGGRRQVFDAESGLALTVPSKSLSKLFGYNAAVWEDVEAADGAFPSLFCNDCYDRGAWENWCFGIPMKGSARAHSEKTRATPDDGMFDGIGDGDEPETSLFASEPGSP